jgi:DEAD/DEAH box helicase domain-containing protein
VNANEIVDGEQAYLLKFRTSADFISRTMAPSILNHLEKGRSTNNKIVLHDGQQYISFADSRQLAAKATLKQNLEQERMWFYSTIYHELCKRKAQSGSITNEIMKLQAEIMQNVSDMSKSMKLLEQINQLQKKQKDYISWMEVADILRKNKYCELFCNQFVKRSDDSDELDQNGKIPSFI